DEGNAEEREERRACGHVGAEPRTRSTRRSGVLAGFAGEGVRSLPSEAISALGRAPTARSRRAPNGSKRRARRGFRRCFNSPRPKGEAGAVRSESFAAPAGTPRWERRVIQCDAPPKEADRERHRKHFAGARRPRGEGP